MTLSRTKSRRGTTAPLDWESDDRALAEALFVAGVLMLLSPGHLWLARRICNASLCGFLFFQFRLINAAGMSGIKSQGFSVN